MAEQGRRSRRSLLKLGGAGAVAAAAAMSAGVTALAGSPDVYNVVTDFHADPTGANDSTAAIQNAIDAAKGSNGGTVSFPVGNYVCSGQLDLDASAGIWLEGAGAVTAGSSPGSEIHYTGSAASFISARSSAGFTLRRLGIFYTNSAFTGVLVDLSRPDSGTDTAFALVTNCVLSGAGPTSAAALVNLDRTIVSTVRQCNLAGAQTGLSGIGTSGHYSNAIQVESCQFVGLVAASIRNPGDAWLIAGCTFEALQNGAAGAVACGFGSHGLSVIGCWLGDVTATGASTQISFQGDGLLVQGNLIGGSTGTTGISVASGSTGVDVRANAFVNHATGVQLGSGSAGVTVAANSFQGVATNVAGTLEATDMVQTDAGFGIGVLPGSPLHVNGALSIGAGPVDAGQSGNGQLLPGTTSPTSIQQTFSTDGTGWQYRIAKNLKGTITDLVAVVDNGNVGLGVMNPTFRLQLDTDSAAKPGTSAWSNPSDLRLKDEESIARFQDGMDVVRRMRPVRYRYNGRAGLPRSEHVGVVAQEAATAMPYAIERFRARLEPDDADETELLAFNPHALQYVLLNALQEVDARLRRMERPRGARKRRPSRRRPV